MNSKRNSSREQVNLPKLHNDSWKYWAHNWITTLRVFKIITIPRYSPNRAWLYVFLRFPKSSILIQNHVLIKQRAYLMKSARIYPVLQGNIYSFARKKRNNFLLIVQLLCTFVLFDLAKNLFINEKERKREKFRAIVFERNN